MIDLSNVIALTLGSTPVEQIADSLGNVLWSAAPVVLPNYFYVEDVSGSDNTVSIRKSNTNAPTIEIFASTDTVNWSSIGSTSTTAITATVPANGKLYLKCTTSGWGGSSFGNVITCSDNHNIGGNIMSLIYNDDFEDKTTFPNGSTHNFYYLFQNNTKVINTSNLVLPATTLANSCYSYMFSGCTSLTTAPALPATTLTTSCYSYMFNGCTSLTAAPVLPATTLTTSCYNKMFWGCTSLTTAPALPATTLANNCYQNMFTRCASLTTAPTILPATRLKPYCYGEMFSGCTSLTTAPALPATALVNNCYRSMFEGCTSLTTAPTLPATTLASNCYQYMFGACTNLATVTTYAQDISASSCLYNWLKNVAATGDFYNLGGATYPSGANGIPSGWTEHTSL